jgi:hypothetical protein
LTNISHLQLSNEETLKGVIFDKPPPDSEAHICNAEESWPGLLTVSNNNTQETERGGSDT